MANKRRCIDRIRGSFRDTQSVVFRVCRCLPVLTCKSIYAEPRTASITEVAMLDSDLLLPSWLCVQAAEGH